MTTINIIIWAFIILLCIFGTECFIRPPKGDYGQTAGFAYGCAFVLFCIWIMLNK